MRNLEGVTFDTHTLKLLRAVLDSAWDSLPVERQRVMLKSDMARRLLTKAAEGERDPLRLRAVALLDLLN